MIGICKMRKSRRKLKGVSEIEEDPLPEAETRPTQQDVVKVKAEDAECVVNIIAPPEGDPEGRVQRVLEILKQEERNCAYSCFFRTSLITLLFSEATL